MLNVYMLLLDFFLSKRDVFEIVSKMDSAVNGNAYWKVDQESALTEMRCSDGI